MAQAPGWGSLVTKKEDSTQPGWGSLVTKKEDSTQVIPANKPQNWGELLSPSFKGQAEMRKVDAISQDLVKKSGAGEGALSSETHDRQMRVVDRSLDKMVDDLGVISGDIVKACKDFMDHVHESNKDIGNFCRAIFKRGMDNDPTLGVDDVVKAQALVQFAKLGVETMQSSTEASLIVAEKGGSVISKQTFGAIKEIIDVRSRQVALFAQKIEIFQKQEKHDLETMLKMQEAKLKEQAQLFNQMKEVAQFESECQKTEFSQQLELKRANLDEQIQKHTLEIKEQEVINAKALKEEELRIGERVQNKQMEINKDLEGQRITTDAAVKQQALSYDYQARVQESTDKKQVEMKKSEDQKQAAMWDSTTKIARPCSIQ